MDNVWQLLDDVIARGIPGSFTGAGRYSAGCCRVVVGRAPPGSLLAAPLAGNPGSSGMPLEAVVAGSPSSQPQCWSHALWAVLATQSAVCGAAAPPSLQRRC
jgi:hypothetical protein